MVSWVYKFGFQTVPSGRLDQLDTAFAWGVALFLHSNHKSTLSVQSHVRTLQALAKYTLNKISLNKIMIHLTEN
jgi:hypothetical protein